MTVQDHLRTLLESNKSVFLSGEEIARRLGVSRNAVWKAIKALQADGYPIQAVPNRGYCLASSSDVLSESGIRRSVDGRIECQSKAPIETMIITATSAAMGIPATTSPVSP